MLGKSKLSAGQVERLWARDRKNLQACKNKHGTIVVYYTGRDAGLAGE